MYSRLIIEPKGTVNSQSSYLHLLCAGNTGRGCHVQFMWEWGLNPEPVLTELHL